MVSGVKMVYVTKKFILKLQTQQIAIHLWILGVNLGHPINKEQETLNWIQKYAKEFREFWSKKEGHIICVNTKKPISEVLHDYGCQSFEALTTMRQSFGIPLTEGN